jgi:hypothetical protein
MEGSLYDIGHLPLPGDLLLPAEMPFQLRSVRIGDQCAGDRENVCRIASLAARIGLGNSPNPT